MLDGMMSRDDLFLTCHFFICATRSIPTLVSVQQTFQSSSSDTSRKFNRLAARLTHSYLHIETQMKYSLNERLDFPRRCKAYHLFRFFFANCCFFSSSRIPDADDSMTLVVRRSSSDSPRRSNSISLSNEMFFYHILPVRVLEEQWYLHHLSMSILSF